MDMTYVFKIAAVGIIIAVLNQILSRSGRDDYALLVTLSGIVVILTMLVPQIKKLLAVINDVFDL